MNSVQLVAVLYKYEEKLRGLGYKTVTARHDLHEPAHVEAINHVLHMCPKARELVAEGEVEKAQRWLGFIQGILWTGGIYSIDEMREHNR